MAGKDNLKPQNKRTKDEQREIAQKGGEASGKSRRKRKTYREILNALLTAPLPPAEIIGETTAERMKSFPRVKNIDEATAFALVLKALKGDVRAFETIRDTIGEKPVEKQERVEVVVQHNPFKGLSVGELRKLAGGADETDKS